jgi:predicted Zn-dependent protease
MLLSPTAAVPHRYVADCLAQAGQRDLALREYRLAHAFGDAGALAAAADRYPTLEDLLGVVPETPEGLRGAGERLLAHGRPSEAVEAYRRAWETYGDRAALEPLARAALGAGDAPGAAEAARTLSELEPHRPAGHLILFRALSSQGHPAEAWAALEAGAALAPGSLELLEPLADRAASEGRYAEARRLLASVVPRNAADAASRLVVEARVLRRQGRLGEAARLLEAAAATGPRSAARQEEYADVLVAMGRYDDAIASLRRAAALPGSEAAVYAEKIRVVEMKAAERRP